MEEAAIKRKRINDIKYQIVYRDAYFKRYGSNFALDGTIMLVQEDCEIQIYRFFTDANWQPCIYLDWSKCVLTFTFQRILWKYFVN